MTINSIVLPRKPNRRLLTKRITKEASEKKSNHNGKSQKKKKIGGLCEVKKGFLNVYFEL
jgi:hypothetical protein